MFDQCLSMSVLCDPLAKHHAIVQVRITGTLATAH